MAFGQFTGYTPAPQPGAYNFQQQNGQSILLSGPAALGLKQRLDASSGLAGQRVAGPGGGAPSDGIPSNSPMAGSEALNAAPPAPSPAGPAMSVAPPESAAPAMSVAPPQSEAAPAPAPPPAGVEGVPPMIARPPEQPTPTAHPLVENGINTGYVQGPDGRIYENRPGVAAVTQQQLQAKAASGVATPHSMSESVSGGFTPSQDFLDTRKSLAEQKGQIIDQTAKIEAENSGREQELARQQAAQAAQLKAEEQARTDQIATQVQKDLETKDRLQKEYGSARVDPRRLFSGQGGSARLVLAALSAGLGQAGAGLQGMGGHPTSNVALQTINSAIDRDIAAQENEIKVKGDMANNALSQYQRSGMSLDAARSALRATQLGWATAQNQLAAATRQGSMIQTNAAMLQNGLQDQLNSANEQYRQQSLGNATKSVAEQVVYPHAGAAGGLYAVTPEKATGIANQSTELGGKSVENAQKLYNLQHPKATPAAAKQQGALADVEAARQMIVEAATDAGLAYKDGRLEGDGHAVWNSGIGGGEQSKRYVNKLRAAAPLVQTATGQKRLSEDEAGKWASEGAGRSAESNKIFLQAQLEKLNARERAIRAGGGGVSETAPAAPAEAEPTE